MESDVPFEFDRIRIELNLDVSVYIFIQYLHNFYHIHLLICSFVNAMSSIFSMSTDISHQTFRYVKVNIVVKREHKVTQEERDRQYQTDSKGSKKKRLDGAKIRI